jgi:hypothetical protein
MADENEKLSIAGLACLLSGIPKIQSWDEGTAQAKVLSEAYEPLVKSELSLYKWRFATTYFNLKPNLTSNVPLSRHNNAYRLPSDPAVMSVDTVLVSDLPIDYERRGWEIHTTDTSDDDVILQYRFRADETEWYPFFRQLVVYRLATVAAFSVARNASIAKEMRELGNEHYKQAKLESAQAQSNQKLNQTRLVRGRRGYNKFWRNR